VFDDGDHMIDRNEYMKIYNYLKNDVEPKITLYRVNALLEINRKLDELLGKHRVEPVIGRRIKKKEFMEIPAPA